MWIRQGIDAFMKTFLQYATILQGISDNISYIADNINDPCDNNTDGPDNIFGSHDNFIA